jgi:hypothetical protein
MPKEEEGRHWAMGGAGLGGKMGQAKRRGGLRKQKGKRKKEKKMRGNKKEREEKGEKLNWEFPNLNNYEEKNKRVFHKIGLKGIYMKRKIKGLRAKDFQRELEIIFIKRRSHSFLIKMKEQGLQM